MEYQYADPLAGLESHELENYYWDDSVGKYRDRLSGLVVEDPSGIRSGDRLISLFQDPVRDAHEYLNGVMGTEQLIPSIDYDTTHSILPVFTVFGKDLDITPKWCMTLRKYVYGFTTRNEQYAEFFGSPYLGTVKVVFTSADRNQWFSEIFDVDEEDLKENLYACKLINPEWKVTSDVFNLSIPYLLHRLLKSDVADGIKHQAMIDVVSMYHYKCLTSIMINDYPYLAKKELAMETYNRLSLRYDIKKYGSWRALIEARAEFIINPKTGIHYQTFAKMNDDKAILYMVGDIQDRLRGVCNDINKVFHDVKNRTNIVKIDNGTVKLEDGVGVKEISKQVNQFQNYLVNVLTSKVGFYKSELIKYAADAIPNTPQDKLDYVVKVFPDQYNAPKGEKYRLFVEEVTLHLFEYTTTNGINFNDLRDVLRKMKGAYLSQRSQNQSVLLMRDTGDALVREMTGIRTRNIVTSIRTSLMLYIVLRMLTRQSYS